MKTTGVPARVKITKITPSTNSLAAPTAKSPAQIAQVTPAMMSPPESADATTRSDRRPPATSRAVAFAT